MTDYYLKFVSEEQAIRVLEGYQGSIDIIGEIPDATGWHVNVRGEPDKILSSYAVEVTTPYRIWA